MTSAVLLASMLDPAWHLAPLVNRTRHLEPIHGPLYMWPTSLFLIRQFGLAACPGSYDVCIV